MYMVQLWSELKNNEIALAIDCPCPYCDKEITGTPQHAMVHRTHLSCEAGAVGKGKKMVIK